MDELNKMDVVETAVDTISDAANSTGFDAKSVGVGIGVGGALAAAGIFVWRKFIKPKMDKSRERRAKEKLEKAKRAGKVDDIPEDIEKEYPIG